ncbi:PREDICTED: glycine receptor subunit alphaZ1-like isoform X1 [Branchiostoma belcheri]|uniref:Glycine receptor subunit alphaZ1-like isoform X1 n=1 Tax=Branchiostoma belcheri TaxID=7741 RepID=A0A6P5A7V2_BRABE|nr:PREDICTED: glycine receptor subunit alphaZ1-like isoform X1 [Branchiostoma belcheri]
MRLATGLLLFGAVFWSKGLSVVVEDVDDPPFLRQPRQVSDGGPDNTTDSNTGFEAATASNIGTTPASMALVLQMLDNYDQRLRPDFRGGAVTVTFQLYILTMGSISESSMDYVVTVFLRQQWNDPRFVYTGFDGNLTLYDTVIDDVWLPDVFFVNEKAAGFASSTGTSRMMRIHPNGDVLYSTKKTALLACPMNFALYPMDSQECSIKIESFSHTTMDINLKWSEVPIVVNEAIRLPEFQITDVNSTRCDAVREVGTFSCLEGRFKMVRRMGYYIIQTYIPSILIVILSWLTFWISPEIAPARVALGITTVLTSTTFTAINRSTMPRFSYVRAIDIWLLACSFFIFAALVEFAAVHFLFKRHKKFGFSGRLRRLLGLEHPPPEGTEEVELKPSASTTSERLLLGGGHTQIRLENAEPKPAEVTGEEEKHHRTLEELKALYQKRARRIDLAARIVFPSVFCIFNLCYWGVFLPQYEG